MCEYCEQSANILGLSLSGVDSAVYVDGGRLVLLLEDGETRKELSIDIGCCAWCGRSLKGESE